MVIKTIKRHRHLEALNENEPDGAFDYISDDDQSRTAYLEIEELEQILKRLLKLSNQADNPGVAYRNLETIHALTETLIKKLGLEIEPLPTPPDNQRPSRKIKS